MPDEGIMNAGTHEIRIKLPAYFAVGEYLQHDRTIKLSCSYANNFPLGKVKKYNLEWIEQDKIRYNGWEITLRNTPVSTGFSCYFECNLQDLTTG